MAELAKCPICEDGGDVKEVGCCVCCAQCGFGGPNCESNELVAEAWNHLCEAIRVGKKLYEMLPSGYRLASDREWSGCGDDIVILFEPIPAPLSQADVLRDFREMLDAPGDLTIPAEAKTIWCRNIDAVLEAEE